MDYSTEIKVAESYCIKCFKREYRKRQKFHGEKTFGVFAVLK